MKNTDVEDTLVAWFVGMMAMVITALVIMGLVKLWEVIK